MGRVEKQRKQWASLMGKHLGHVSGSSIGAVPEHEEAEAGEGTYARYKGATGRFLAWVLARLKATGKNLAKGKRAAFSTCQVRLCPLLVVIQARKRQGWG